MAQSHHSYSRITDEGIGHHDLSIWDIPSRDWSTLFRPWELPALFLNVTHGFAARWWLMLVVLLMGGYLLLLELTDRIDVSNFFSLGLALSPFFAWWYESASLDSVGLAMLALASFLYSFRAPTATRRFGWLALAVYSTVGSVLILYPPFLIPTALIMATIGVCELAGRHSEGGASWRRIATDFALVVIGAGVILAVYYLHARGALRADNNTIYPGHRRVSGGGTQISQLLSAPFGLSLAKNGLGLTTTNQSEISSFLILGPFALLQMLRMRVRELTFRWRVLLLGTAAIFVLMATWYLISLPPFIASLLFLDRVPGSRSIVGVGVSGILLMALLCVAEFKPPSVDSAERPSHTTSERRWRINSGAVVCGFVAFGMYFWAGRDFVSSFPILHLGLRGAGLASAGAAVVVFLTSPRRVLAGGLAFVIFGAVMALPVNPIYSGLGPLTTSPLLATFTTAASQDREPGHPVWLSYEGPAVTDVLLASGLQTVNAINLYPDEQGWRLLDPQGASAHVWNRYANLLFVPSTGTSPVITLLQADAIEIAINP